MKNIQKNGKILFEQEKQRKMSESPAKNQENSKSEVLSVGSLQSSKRQTSDSKSTKKAVKKTNLRNSTARKISTTVNSHTETLNSVRLQIPESTQYAVQDTIS